MSPHDRARVTRTLAALIGAAAVGVPGAGQAAVLSPTLSLSVLASSSLESAFPRIDAAPEYSFADSDLLANSIRAGARGDVYASAGAQQAAALARAGKISKPVAFATTRLVLIVPRSNPGHVRSVLDLSRKGVSLALGDPVVSFGNQGRAVLSRLGLGTLAAKVKGGLKDPRQLASQVAAGKVKAGILYATDLAAVKSKVKVISIPAKGSPTVTFEIATVKSTSHGADAQAFIRKVLSATGRAALKAAGFGKA
jgi:molybdate transport system substrate-binding protein